MKLTRLKYFICSCLLIGIIFLGYKGMYKVEDRYEGQIFLFGEYHGVKEIYEKELEIWGYYYETQDMRHLFIELPYYTAEFLNIWMKANDDAILMQIYDDIEGTLGHNEYALAFFRRIKSNYPETIFHGTDVGHRYETNGKRFVTYLEVNKLKNTYLYAKTKENIKQGEIYYRDKDFDYRENKMVENFIEALKEVNSSDVMGIYGSAHTELDQIEFTDSVDGMAKQLVNIYGNQVHSQDLSLLFEN